MTSKTDSLYNDFVITKSGSKWKATSNDGGFTTNKNYPKTYSLEKAYKTYLNYALKRQYAGGGQ